MRSAHIFLLLIISGLLLASESGVIIQAASPWSDPRGYTPVVVTAEANRDLTLSLQVGDDEASAATTLHLAEGRTLRQTLLIPPSNAYSVPRHQVTWSGPGGISGTVSVSDRGRQRVLGALIDPKQQVDLPKLTTALGKRVSGFSRSGSGDLIQRVMPEELPDRWQGYPNWLVLVLTPQGDTQLNEAQRLAIAAWTRSGGSLVVSTSTLQQTWEKRQAVVYRDPLTGDAATLADLLGEQSAEESWKPLDAPVPGTELVPVKTFVVLALAFAIVVGPLNLWWVRRRNARYLFLITTPALSFVTCGVLIVASLLADGVSIKRSAVQVGYLDQRTQQLIRWTGCTYFAAFARSQLELDAQTKLRVLDPDSHAYGYRNHNDGQRLHLDWSNGQRVNGTVLPARLNRQLAYIEHLPERRRLIVSQSGNEFQVINGLGVLVNSLSWRDANGVRWWTGSIAVGESAVLQRSESSTASRSDDDSSTLPSRLANRIGRDVAVVHQRVTSQPYSFSATLAAPLDPLPGPESIDPEPPAIMLFGHLTLGTGAESNQ